MSREPRRRPVHLGTPGPQGCDGTPSRRPQWLRWGPEVEGDTTKPIPLPLIDEDEEDEWIKSGNMALPCAELSGEESESDLWSDSDDIWTSSEDEDSSSDWESVTDADEVDACDQVPIGGCGRRGGK
ncbi:uncharacterized protein N7515_000257 [Penicillium bovifimosum]|uniref:Uncharacterized protein n=1 Tax=Penicillium bovifimosum TaxID=126998 RepID=A0A9W9HFD1_9EURO|nr:uncharacterized protein N7515_000257 [Penicillium bovifimosum]KAJ5145693.1 hypothetical protein N7515_000257 [Penicillium bovifimosum]